MWWLPKYICSALITQFAWSDLRYFVSHFAIGLFGCSVFPPSVAKGMLATILGEITQTFCNVTIMLLCFELGKKSKNDIFITEKIDLKYLPCIYSI